MAATDEQLDALYAAPLTAFVTERKALVASLKAAGDKAGAKEVGALKKPSLPAWVLNQLARRHLEALERVLSSLDRQRDLQLGALDGGLDSEALHAARAEERSATAELMRCAGPILEEGGQAASKGNLDRASKALRAVALHGPSRELLLEGRLQQDAPSGGFEAAAEQIDPALLLAALSGAPKRPKKPSKKGDDFFARSVRLDGQERDAAPRKNDLLEALQAATGAEEAPAVPEPAGPEPAGNESRPAKERASREPAFRKSRGKEPAFGQKKGGAPKAETPPAQKAKPKTESAFRKSRGNEPAFGKKPAKTKPAVEAPPPSARAEARAKAERLEKVARRAEAEARLATLRVEQADLEIETESARARVEELRGELERAELEARRVKRRLAEVQERIRKAEKRIALLDS